MYVVGKRKEFEYFRDFGWIALSFLDLGSVGGNVSLGEGDWMWFCYVEGEVFVG